LAGLRGRRGGLSQGGTHHAALSGNPDAYYPNHTTGVKLPDDFAVTPLQYVD
jgi:hypothetical protein